MLPASFDDSEKGNNGVSVAALHVISRHLDG